MNKNLAKSLQNLIEQLDATWETSDFYCGIFPRYEGSNDSQWITIIAERNEYNYRLIELCGLVSAISSLCNHINFRFTTWDIGTSSPDEVQAIMIY